MAAHGLQNRDLDWGDGREVRLTYQPTGSVWKVSADYRYGRANTNTARLHLEEAAGPKQCAFPINTIFGQAFCNKDFSFGGGPPGEHYDARLFRAAVNFSDSSVKTNEDQEVVDFAVGRDVGFGAMGMNNGISAGLRYASLKSTTDYEIRTVKRTLLDWWNRSNATQDTFTADLLAEREFEGLGPTLGWDAALPLLGSETSGHLDVDWSITGGVLFGKTNTRVGGDEAVQHYSGRYLYFPFPKIGDPIVTEPPAARKTDATVPVLDLSLGLSYEIQRMKVSTGYRWERYFNALDAGYAEHKDYDRTIDGPYFKIAVGFGG
jgi:hypothetical protein